MSRTRWIAILAAVTLAAVSAAFTAADLARADEPPAAADADAARIEALVQRLGADDFQAREQASTELAALGEAARPALAKAAEASESPEVRWRARQLLQRLDGAGPRPLGTPPADEPDGEGSEPDPPDGLPEGAGRDMRRWLEELGRSVGRHRPGSLPGFGDVAFSVTRAPGLRLERTEDGVRLHVEGHDVPYEGASLEAILEAHPELAEHESMDLLRRRVAMSPFFPGGPFDDLRRFRPFDPFASFRDVTSGRDVRITHSPDGVEVVVRERGEDGEVTEKRYTGTSIEEIRREHPEVADKLPSIDVQILGPGDVEERARALLEEHRERMRRWVDEAPAPPRWGAPRPPAADDGPRFGVGIEPVEDVLAYHVGLPEGEGVLVREVVPGSAAAALGVERHDILHSVDGETLRFADAAARIGALVAEAGGIERATVIRRGRRVELPPQ